MSAEMNIDTQQEPCAGFISLVYFDDALGESVTIGGAGFLTEQAFREAWANVPEFGGPSSFQADHLDSQGDIVNEKTVSPVTCEALTGKPITTLIIEGRAKLAIELANYRKAP